MASESPEAEETSGSSDSDEEEVIGDPTSDEHSMGEQSELDDGAFGMREVVKAVDNTTDVSIIFMFCT